MRIGSTSIVLLLLLVASTSGSTPGSPSGTISRIVTVGGASESSSAHLEERGHYFGHPHPFAQPQYHAEYGPSGPGPSYQHHPPVYAHTPAPPTIHWPPEPHHNYHPQTDSHHHGHADSHHVNSHHHGHDSDDLEDYHHSSGSWWKGSGGRDKGGGLVTSVVRSVLALLGAKLVLKAPLLLLKLLIAPVLLLAPLLSVLVPVYVATTTTTTTTSTTTTTTTTAATVRRRKGKLGEKDEQAEQPTTTMEAPAMVNVTQPAPARPWRCGLSVACQLGVAWGFQGYQMMSDAGIPVGLLDEYREEFLSGARSGICEDRVEQCRQELEAEGRLERLPGGGIALR